MPDPAFNLDALPVSRRVAIAQLLRETLATERELASLYADFEARSRLEPLKAGLAELARGKAAHVAALEPLVRALDSLPTSDRTEGRQDRDGLGDVGRGALFSRAFEHERALEVSFRELAALVGERAYLPQLAELAKDAARHQRLLRELYLRYS